MDTLNDDQTAATAADESTTVSDEAAEAAAMEAGFNHAETGEPLPEALLGTQSTEQHDEDEPAGDEKADDKSAEAVTTDAEQPATAEPLTPEQRAYVEGLLAEQDRKYQERMRRLEGQYGNLNGQIKKFGESRVTITPDVFKKTRELGYDEFADSLGEDLGNLFPAPESEKEPAVDDLVAQAKTQAHQEWVEKYLNGMTPGWQDTLRSESFGTWLGSLPDDERSRVEANEDPDQVIADIKSYTAWESQRTKAANEQAARDKRLAGAEPATTSGPGPKADPPMTEAQAMELGFKKAGGVAA